ncbi:hypothetical protein [Acidiphilium sp. C61]|nr:hypothetical protein [Acidiphilium sp. C61]
MLRQQVTPEAGRGMEVRQGRCDRGAAIGALPRPAPRLVSREEG